MADPIPDEYSDYAAFVAEWPTEEPDETMPSRWQLLGLLEADEVLVLLPEWLASEKVGYW